MEKRITCAPREYAEQHLIQCGACSAWAILSAFGKDTDADPSKYIPRLWGIPVPFLVGSYTWARILRRQGIPAKRGNARRLSNVGRIALLKQCIDENRVVMLRTGSGYLGKRYISWIAAVRGHWVTVWGYNDHERVFYVYDSMLPRDEHDTTIPVGNSKRTYTELLRDWGAGFPFIWRYAYIKAG